jgi:hypothetical protein
MEDDDILLVNMDDTDPVNRGPVKMVDMSDASVIRKRMKEPLSVTPQADIKLGKFGTPILPTKLYVDYICQRLILHNVMQE